MAENNDKTPADILNPIFTLVDDKESEILDLKDSFLDDDAISDNVIFAVTKLSIFLQMEKFFLYLSHEKIFLTSFSLSLRFFPYIRI